jgi:hypothetical protein
MREPIACGLLIACAALFPSQNAAGEEPSRRIVPARGSPNTVGRATRARGNASIPPKRRANVPSLNTPTRSPANVRPVPPLNTQPARMGGNPVDAELPRIGGQTVDSLDEIAITVTVDSDKSDVTPVKADQCAFLLPVWSPGFWAMPPGGLTRYLFPSRNFVNPDQTLIDAALSDDAVNRETN